MAVYDRKDVCGFVVGESLFCHECLEAKNLACNGVLLDEEIEQHPDKIYLCDGCGKEIVGFDS